MKRIALLAPNLDVGGAERVVVELATRLPRDRFEVQLVLLSARGELLDEVPDEVPVFDLGVDRGRQAPARLARLVRALRPAVVQSHLTQATLPLLAASPALPRSTRIVPTEHTPLSAVIDRHRRPRIWVAAHRLLYRRADRVIAVSEAVGADVRRVLGPHADVTVVTNPIHLDEPVGPSPYGPGPPPLLAVGRLAPEKGFDRLIDAFAAVVPVRAGARLVIIGEGPERARLQAEIDRRGLATTVELAGYQAEVGTWLAHAAAVAAAAHVEGLPLALLEALAAGTPVVAYDSVGGTGELLADVEGGVLVPDGDRDAFVRQLVAALDGELASPVLPTRFAPSSAIEGYARVLDG